MGIQFALVRVRQKLPPLPDFYDESGHVHAVEGYIRMDYLKLKENADKRSRSVSPQPKAIEEHSASIISIRTLMSVSCFFKSKKNDRVRAFAGLMMLRLHHNLPIEDPSDPNNGIASECMGALVSLCSSNLNLHLREDLEHFMRLRQPGFAIISAPLHDDTLVPVDPVLAINSRIQLPQRCSPANVSAPTNPLASAQELWRVARGGAPGNEQVLSHVPKTLTSPSAPPLETSIASASATAPDFWHPLPPNWIRCCDVQGKFCIPNAYAPPSFN
jgi:hypothetical protein